MGCAILSDGSDKSDGSDRSTPEGCLFHSPGVEARSAEDPG